MKTNIGKLIIIVLLAGCHPEPGNNKIIIKGSVENDAVNMEGRKLYLYELAYDVPRDSAVVRKGAFYFEMVADSNFMPFRAMLKYADTSRDPQILKLAGVPYFFAYRHPLGFTNPYGQTIESIFYAGKGTTVIKVDKKSGKFVHGGLVCTIETSSRQNEPYFRHIEPGMHTAGSIKQKGVLDYNISIIKKYPFSVHLLTSFYYNKNAYTTAELKLLTALFDSDIKKTSLYKSFSEYFVYRESGAGESPNDLILANADNKRSFVVDRSARLNMLVFWASWCGPCRKEIPALKQLLTKYTPKGLSLSSISIDTDTSSWRTALVKEQMPWKQFIVCEADKTTIENKYSVHAVPVAFLVDQHNRVVEKLMNLDSTAIKKIEKYLSL